MAEHTKTPWKIAGAVHIYSPGEGGGNVCSMSDPRVSTVVGYTDVAGAFLGLPEDAERVRAPCRRRRI
jgi:hypothetical protein